MQKLALGLILVAVGTFLAGCAPCRKPIEYTHTYVVDRTCTIVDNGCTAVCPTDNCGR